MKKQTFILKNHYQEESDVMVQAQLEINNKIIKLKFKVKGKVNNYIFPKLSTQQRANNLWKSTCCELFFAHDGEKRYREINISPSAQWNIYQLKEYRGLLEEEKNLSEPTIKTVQEEDCYQLSFQYHLDEEIVEKNLIFNLAVVLLNVDEVRSFYTINRTTKAVDFHDKEHWILA